MKLRLFTFFIIFLLFPPFVYLANAQLSEGITEYRAENYEEALKILVSVREKDPQSSVAAFYTGMAYKQTGDYKSAKKNLEDALTLVPNVNDAYTEIVEVLYNLNQFDEALLWVKKAEKVEVKPAHIAFLKGLVLAKKKDNKKGIAAFKAAKELDPSFSQPADFQIALLLTKEKKFKEAMESLKAVTSIDPTTEIASFAKEYEKALAKRMEMLKPWKFTVGLSYQYDDNVVLSPTTNIVNITDEEDSSLTATFNVDYTHPVKAPWSLNIQYNLYSNTYNDINSHNVITQSLTAIPGYNFRKGAVTFPIAYRHMWFHEETYMSTFSFKPTFSYLLKGGNIGILSVKYSNEEYLQGPINSDEDRDANILSLSMGLLHPFLEKRGMVNLGYEFAIDNKDGKNWDNISNRVNAAVLVPISTKVSFMLSTYLLRQDYRHHHTVSASPFYSREREDTTYSVSTLLRWKVRKGLDLIAQYTHTRDDSNIAIYDYERDIFGAGVEYRF